MIYAIGDIHGQSRMLRALLSKIAKRKLSKLDQLVFLGDYIDRGNDTRGVIKQLIALRRRRPNTVFLRGNHEQMILDARAGFAPRWEGDKLLVSYDDPVRMWLLNGGREALRAYGVALNKNGALARWADSIPQSHWSFIEETSMEYVVGSYHFVHAGLLPAGMTWDGTGTATDPRLWIRDEFLDFETPDGAEFGGRLVVFGHTPQESGRPLVQRNKIGIDTAAAFGGPLSAAVFDPDNADPRGTTPEFLQEFP